MCVRRQYRADRQHIDARGLRVDLHHVTSTLDDYLKARILFPFICLFLREYPVGAVARPL